MMIRDIDDSDDSDIDDGSDYDDKGDDNNLTHSFFNSSITVW
jgi:hypothetical protein